MGVLNNYHRMTRDFKKFWMQTQGRLGTTEVSLPFKQKGIKNPNNRSRAFKKDAPVRKKVKKDGSFFEDYQCFMDDLAANGFSRKVTSLSTDDSTWYLPHHGAYHPC